MKKINTLISILLMTTVSSCNFQNGYDLENVIGKKTDEVINEVPHEFIDREIVTHQPAYQIREGIDRYKFGNINFVVDEEDFSEESYIIFILKSNEEKKIVGLFIHVENNKNQAEKMKEYLVNKYGKEEMIQPEPTEKRSNGLILGNSAYYWLDKQNNCSIYYYVLYSGRNKKQVIGYNVEIIQNDAILSENPDWKIIDWYKTRF